MAIITCIIFHIPTCLRHKRSCLKGCLKHNDSVESQLGDSRCLHLLLCDPEVAPSIFNPLSNSWPDGKSLELLYSTAEKLPELDINYSLEIGLTFVANQKKSPSILKQHIFRASSPFSEQQQTQFKSLKFAFLQWWSYMSLHEVFNNYFYVSWMWLYLFL